MLAVAFTWGLTFVIIKDALAGIGPFYFVALRFLLALALLILLYWQRLAAVNVTTLLVGAWIGLFLLGGYVFQTLGLLYTGPATAGFVNGLAVVVVPVFYAIIYRRLPGPLVLTGVISATLGLAFLTLTTGSAGINPGDFLILCGAICFGLHIIMVGHYAMRYNHDPVLLAMVQIAVTALGGLGLALALERFPTGGISLSVWAALIFTALPATALALVIQNTVQRYTAPTQTAIILTMEPVFAAITAHLLGREILTLSQGVGCMLILAGMLVAASRGSRI